MEIRQKKFLFKPKGDLEWSKTHAQVPFVLQLEDKFRVFYSTRDNNSRSAVSFVDFENLQDFKIIGKAEKPCLSYGMQGFFDDSGTMPSWVVKERNRLLLYYTGWNRSKDAAYRLSIGIAESFDQGLTFQRLFNGPIMDRGPLDAVWVGQPCVIKISDDDWRMWYLSCEKIEILNGIPEPFYNVKYAVSNNGIEWIRTGDTCIDFNEDTDAIGRPCVWRYNNKFWMIHSNRKAKDYRTNNKASYRLVLSSSINGIKWETELDPLIEKDGIGWADKMTEYASIFPLVERGEFLILHNGNGFGATGFGSFILKLP